MPAEEPNTPREVTAAEAARIRGVSRNTVIAAIKQGIVPGRKDPNFGGWLIPESSIEAIPKRPRGRPWPKREES